MRTVFGTAESRWLVAVIASLVLVSWWALPGLSSPVSADPPGPHTSGGATTDTCAACHRTHSGSNETLLERVSQSTLCFACHDGTGSIYNVAAEYTDPNVPADDYATSSFYSHAATTLYPHRSAREDEFGGALNRHAECSDCHNPHSMTDAVASATASGWLASGALHGTAGVAATSPPAWKDPLVYEYELCVKCHSSYTQLLSYTQPSRQKTDKAAEFDPTNASYHPLFAPGKNTTTAMDNSLAGGSLWQFTTASTIRCVNCHANGSLASGAPAAGANLAPHASEYRGILLAPYRSRDLKPAGEAFVAADFQLCFLCHSSAPFATTSPEPRNDTNFPAHGLHMTSIAGTGSGSLDIDELGAGQGNAICAECHFRSHSTRFAIYTDNQKSAA